MLKWLETPVLVEAEVPRRSLKYNGLLAEAEVQVLLYFGYIILSAWLISLYSVQCSYTFIESN